MDNLKATNQWMQNNTTEKQADNGEKKRKWQSGMDLKRNNLQTSEQAR